MIFNLQIDGGVNTKDANATANDILSSKTAYVGKEKVTGTMPNNGNGNNAVSNGSVKAGYTSGGKITNLDAANIKKGVSIGGVVGSYQGTIVMDDCKQIKLSMSSDGASTQTLSLPRRLSHIVFTSAGICNIYFLINKENPSDFKIIKTRYKAVKHADEQVIIGTFDMIYTYTGNHNYKGVIPSATHGNYDMHINMDIDSSFTYIRFNYPTYQEPYSGGYEWLYVQAFY